jgi:omega-6 fatty acid desaturase (delta-12 desaturase)
VLSSEERSTRKRTARPAWHGAIAAYARPDRRKAIWQLVNTFVPYAALWALMVYMVQQGVSYWLTLAVAVVAAAFLVRIFIFFHDAGHGSFFASPRANTLLGYVSGVLTFTPYHDWRHAHATHHATAGNLDRRGVGDVWTMTVEEYRTATQGTRLGYRLIRNPLIMFTIGPAYAFLIRQRWPRANAGRSDVNSVIITNVAIAAIIVLASLTIGFKTYVLIQLPTMLIAGVLGLWLFYVQHQYEGVYWARDEEWDSTRAGLEGSSYYKLPKVLQWLTGNIGLHHIHHLRPRIPNYHLQACYDGIPAMREVEPLSFWQSLKSLRMNLWDEENQRLVTFRSLS